jgi:hypothetical protein
LFTLFVVVSMCIRLFSSPQSLLHREYPHYSKKRFSTFNNSILQFKQWLIDNNCFDVCMESTGKYWVPVYNLLEDTIRITVANPKWVKAVKGNKDDKKDSKWIGDLFRFGFSPGSYIPENQFVFFVNTPATVTNLFPVKAVKRTVFKMLSLFAM